MKTASIQEIKQELQSKSIKELLQLCLRLGRFKKENKELLTYLLYEAGDESSFVQSIKIEMDEDFATVNLTHFYFAKKTLRKIVRTINKYCRYSSEKSTELELRLHFCKLMNDLPNDIFRNAVITNLYATQYKKLAVLMDAMHEDLQYEYQREIDKLKKNFKI